MARQKTTCLNMASYKNTPNKKVILESLTKFIVENPSEWIKIHYNGQGTVDDNRIESGKWVCQNDEYICIEDLLDIIIEHAQLGVMVDIISDCNGAMGMFWSY